jgi:hypothetical protein
VSATLAVGLHGIASMLRRKLSVYPYTRGLRN